MSSISMLFFFYDCCCCCLCLPLLCVYCIVSRSHHNGSGHRNKCRRRCGSRTRRGKKEKSGNDLITNRRRLDCLHTSPTSFALSPLLSVTYIDDPTNYRLLFISLQDSFFSSESIRKIHSGPHSSSSWVVNSEAYSVVVSLSLSLDFYSFSRFFWWRR